MTAKHRVMLVKIGTGSAAGLSQAKRDVLAKEIREKRAIQQSDSWCCGYFFPSINSSAATI